MVCSETLCILFQRKCILFQRKSNSTLSKTKFILSFHLLLHHMSSKPGDMVESPSYHPHSASHHVLTPKHLSSGTPILPSHDHSSFCLDLWFPNWSSCLEMPPSVNSPSTILPSLSVSCIGSLLSTYCMPTPSFRYRGYRQGPPSHGAYLWAGDGNHRRQTINQLSIKQVHFS